MDMDMDMDVDVDEKCWIERLPNEILKPIMELLVTFEGEYRPELSEYDPIDSRDLRALASAWPGCRQIAQQLYYVKLHIRNFKNNKEKMPLHHEAHDFPSHHMDGTKKLFSLLDTKQNLGSLCREVRLSMTNRYPYGYRRTQDTALLAKTLGKLLNIERLYIHKRHHEKEQTSRMWTGILKPMNRMGNLKEASLGMIYDMVELEQVLDVQWGPNMKKLQLLGRVGGEHEVRWEEFFQRPIGRNISSLSLDIRSSNALKTAIFQHWATPLEKVSFYRQDDYRFRYRFVDNPTANLRHVHTIKVMEVKDLVFPDMDPYPLLGRMYDFSKFTALEDLKVHRESLLGDSRSDLGPITDDQANWVLGAPRLRKFTWCLAPYWWKDGWGAQLRWLRGLAQAAINCKAALREIRVELDVKPWNPPSIEGNGWRPELNLRDELERMNQDCGDHIVVTHNLGGIKA